LKAKDRQASYRQRPGSEIGRLSTSFHKFGNVLATPSPGPPRLMKAPAAAHPLPRGERVRLWGSDPFHRATTLSPRGEGAGGTRAGEGARAEDRNRSHTLA
jgi:hypothetical protein